MSEHLDLADWRRQIAAMYAELRADPEPRAERLAAFRAAKDRLFADHPQSPIPLGERATFTGLAYWPHDPAYRIRAVLEADPAPPASDLPVSTGDPFAFSRVGWARFSLADTDLRLGVYWLAGYGGGIFIPFRDATSGTTTYGGGRYLWDSVKGADLGSAGEELVLDFNYAYHPSCTYDPVWSCPLAPRESWLAAPIEVGERLPGERPPGERPPTEERR
jgi:uncharacterized protein (DUF1684 family)